MKKRLSFLLYHIYSVISSSGWWWF